MNRWLAGALLTSQLVLLVLASGSLPGLAGWPGAAVMALCIAVTTPYWSMLHEAIHGVADRDPRVNEAAGRALGILFGSPFVLLRTGHLLHHRFNRIAEVSEGYDANVTPRVLAAFRHYATVLGGLYWAEVLGGLLLLLPQRAWRRVLGGFGADPRFSAAALAQLSKPSNRRAARMDAAAILALYGGAFLLARWELLAAALCLRALLISFFDNAYHYGTALGERRAARNLTLPAPLSAFILHFNLHGVHHLEPWVPWFELPARAAALDARWSGGLLAAAAMQLKGPIPLQRLQGSCGLADSGSQPRTPTT